MSIDNVQALPLGTQLGDYRLDAVIGHGGFGITYRAFDGQLAKIVAVKEYLPIEFAVRRGSDVVPRGTRFAEDFAWGRERFLDEARALARFRHPHIVPVLRFLEANGTAYTVMEFEDGRSVSELLRKPAARLPADDVRRLAEGLLSGLGAVHAQGFLHRDIKPSNVIIRRDGVPILIDFGAARLAIGGRTQTLTSILTPQYAPIEQYAADGRQGPWSDIYSAAAVLHHAVAGEPPPEAASRVHGDPYRPLAKTQADRFDLPFLAAIDKALAFAPDQRPQTVQEWRTLFGASLPFAHDAPTQRLAPQATAPRLGGVDRDKDERLPPLWTPPRRRGGLGIAITLLLVVLLGLAVWRFQPELSQALTPAPPAPPPQANAAPTPPPTPAPAVTPSPSPTPSAMAQKALVDQAQRAAIEARAVFDKAKEAADAARTMAGEARITAARAARSGLENATRLTSDDGASYVGQASDGKRQGLGVAEAKDGDRQAGEWKDNVLNGLGIERLSDGLRYEGQWRDGVPAGLGVRDRSGADHAEGNFAGGRMEGPGTRRSLAEPSVTQSGEWHADSLDGPGVEILPNGERYEGAFRAGKRQGYGQVIGADGKVQSGRWEDGKLVESAP
jgi:serine/threonine protein kinase